MKLKYVFKTAENDDSIIAVPSVVDEERFSNIIRLNESAAEIFNILQNDVSEEAVIEFLMKKYDVSYERMSIYIHKFIERLEKENLLEYEKKSESVLNKSLIKNKKIINNNEEIGHQKKYFDVPEIEIIEYDFSRDFEQNDGKHSHCKTPFGRDHSHE